jgi:hypothetical protein
VGLIWFASFGPERSLVVARSHGGTLGPLERILVEGSQIDIGDQLAVRRTPLIVTTPDRDVWFEFKPGSEWWYRAALDPAPSVVIDIDSGQGRVAVSSGKVFLKISSILVRVEGGSLKWDSSPRSPVLRVGPGTELFVMDGNGRKIPVHEGNSGMITIERVENSISVDTGLTVDRYPATTGTLIPGKQVLSSVLRFTANQDVPRSLKSVYGHWPRDRWGNIYFYRKRSGTMLIRSGGPDERLFTSDDRVWKGRTE